ncbi:hypothetical protein [Demequina silvatica]|uniref:hypothetical protein n=1 Tax=Demequina silvatica TaxID=1638988 RepID=UPI0007832002|nr:hypothetical protein [Demequina silvatica]
MTTASSARHNITIPPDGERASRMACLLKRHGIPADEFTRVPAAWTPIELTDLMRRRIRKDTPVSYSVHVPQEPARGRITIDPRTAYSRAARLAKAGYDVTVYVIPTDTPREAEREHSRTSIHAQPHAREDGTRNE